MSWGGVGCRQGAAAGCTAPEGQLPHAACSRLTQPAKTSLCAPDGLLVVGPLGAHNVGLLHKHVHQLQWENRGEMGWRGVCAVCGGGAVCGGRVGWGPRHVGQAGGRQHAWHAPVPERSNAWAPAGLRLVCRPCTEQRASHPASHPHQPQPHTCPQPLYLQPGPPAGPRPAPADLLPTRAPSCPIPSPGHPPASCRGAGAPPGPRCE